MISKQYTTAASVAWLEMQLANLARLEQQSSDGMQIKFLHHEEEGTIAVYQIAENAEVKLPTLRRLQQPPWLIKVSSEDQKGIHEAELYLQEKLGVFKLNARE